MEKEQIQSRIKSVVDANGSFGLSLFAYLAGDVGCEIKPIVMTSALKNKLKVMIETSLSSGILSEDAEFDTSDNIADNRKVFYVVNQTEEYQPFKFLEAIHQSTNRYTDENKKNLIGFFIGLNINNSRVWVYQHLYSMARLDKSKHIFAILTGTTYDEVSKDLMQIDSRIDVVIADGSIITRKLDLLQRQFGFESYIREGAKQTIQLIDDLGIVTGLEKFVAYGDKEKLTNAKKLLKAKNSPVLRMEKKTLLANIEKHRRYSKMFKIEDDQILISSQKEASAFIKMINDDYVRSELTGQEYDSSTKAVLEPLN